MNSLKGAAVWTVTQHITDQEWARIALKLGGRTGTMARRGGTARRFVNAVTWVARTGACWSDLPEIYGNWRATYVRFLRWMHDDQWSIVMPALDEGPIKDDLQRLINMSADRVVLRHVRREVRAESRRQHY